METHHNTIYSEIANAILQAIDMSYPGHGMHHQQIFDALGDAPSFAQGHLAFACFPLAKTCKMAPAKIAANLKEKIKLPRICQSAVALGPYCNFFYNTAEVGTTIMQQILSGEFFQQKLTENAPKTMIEYSQPNTHKELHVGHMRNLCLGNAIVRLHQYTGHETLAVTYPGDMGTHVAKCLWYLKNHQTTPAPATEKGAWLGKLYSAANNLLADEKGTDKEEANRNALTAILKQLENRSGEYYDLWTQTREWSIELMQEAYDWAGVDFHHWYFESIVDASSLAYAKEMYAAGKFIKSLGATGMDLSEDKLGFCLMIKSDGTGLYATKDVELARQKFADYAIEKNIYVVDNRQAHHFKQVFKVLEKLGFENSKNCHHLQYEMVELTNGPIASRTGNLVPLMDLVQQMEATIKNEYLARYRNEWTEQEIQQTARMVANGAIKYGMVRVDNNRKIIFDMQEWLKLEGETGPYLQYVHARIHSMCEKLKYLPDAPVDWSLLNHKLEIQLIVTLTKFNTIAVTSCLQYKTHLLCGHLYQLAKMFNSFYAECPIGKAPTEPLKLARLALAKATGLVMAQGLDLLGIPAPHKM